MCQPIVQFCTGSTRPLIFAGAFVALLVGVAIGYTSCTTQALYSDIDPAVAQTRSLAYYLQLATAGYLGLVALLSCHAAYYDQKHSIRALAVISSVTCVFAIVAILMLPASQEVSRLFDDTLKSAQSKYDFKDKYTNAVTPQPPQLAAPNMDLQPTAMNATTPPKAKRASGESASLVQPDLTAKLPIRGLDSKEATKLWDNLQARGCCGRTNGTAEWNETIPKSCCAPNLIAESGTSCKEIDAQHQKGCLALIEAASLNLLIILSLIAMVSFYLAGVSGISSYRTFHYNEANQNAYS